jgi:hypothetical protein
MHNNGVHDVRRRRINSVTVRDYAVKNVILFVIMKFRNYQSSGFVKRLCKTMILHGVSYGCRTWYLISNDEEKQTRKFGAMKDVLSEQLTISYYVTSRFFTFHTGHPKH